jgi:hypothetical protein
MATQSNATVVACLQKKEQEGESVSNHQISCFELLLLLLLLLLCTHQCVVIAGTTQMQTETEKTLRTLHSLS